MRKIGTALFAFAVAILLSAFLLLYLSKDRNITFWISFAFLELSLITSLVITLISVKDSRFSSPFGISLVTYSLLYVTAVTVIDLLFGWLLTVDAKIYLCIHLAALSAYMVIGSLMLLAKRSVIEQNESAYAVSYEQQLLLGEVGRARRMIKELPDRVWNEAGELLSSLDDAIRFSDVISGAAADIDNRIRSKVFSLAYEIDNLIKIQSDDVTAIRSAVSEITQLVESRSLQIRNEKIRI